MGRAFDAITPEIAAFVQAQPVFFVATAPSGPGGHVNLSPKGLGPVAVLDPHEVAYLDLTGSGAETIAHLRDNGRITLMFCAFEGAPNIVRVYGIGEAIALTDERAGAYQSRLAARPGARAVIRVAVDRVSTSCGYGVPRLRYDGDRSDLVDWAGRRDEDGLRDYRASKNARSIDGLPALDPGP